MSQPLHLIAKTLPGCYGPSEGNFLTHSGVSGSVIAVSSHSSVGCQSSHSQLRIGSMKCRSRTGFWVCKASSGGHRRNPDFSRQNKQSFSRNRNRQHEERDAFENFDESDMFSSKNGPLSSLSSTSKFQATAAPGPKEKEIIELFRKVQAQLRERTAAKEEKKVETSQGKGKDNETVDSLLKLLRKHSIEQGKKKISTVNGGDSIGGQSEHSGTYSENKSTSFFNLGKKGRNDVVEPKTPSLTRPPSNFRRKSPVPQIKFQPIYSTEDRGDTVFDLNLMGEKKKQLKMFPDTAQQPELELELEVEKEPESISEPEPAIPDANVFDDFLQGDSSDIDDIEDGNKSQLGRVQDLSLLKLPELRALAKSRGLKGFSKMKKGDLVELLSTGIV